MLTSWLKFSPNPKRNLRIIWGSSLGVGSFLYLKLWLPTTHIGVPCVFHELTGLYCPGCGITRAAASLLSLNFEQAFRYNPLVFVLLPLFLVYLLTRSKKLPRTSNAIMAIMLVAALAFGLLRNFPAFDWLAPTTL
jgi:hypothetical protein